LSNDFYTKFEILEVEIIDTIFLGKIAAAKKERKLTNADIAKLTGYTKATIEAFMCGARDGDAVADAIAKALNIER
jgi:transcriptional regulator with XRE-family HTH domain